MLSKNKIKFIHSLNRKKTRENEKLFLVEGNKLVLEAISSKLPLKLLIATPDFYARNELDSNLAEEVIECSAEELKKASMLQTPQQAMAVVHMPNNALHIDQLTNQLSIALDFIQDPGNLGTIIRMADWFGIRNILCSTDTVDCYNPKVIQASMGAVLRVNVHYLDLEEWLEKANHAQLPVYGTFLEGEDIYRSTLSTKGVLVMGNEGNGISPAIAGKIKHKIHIPAFASGGDGSESLNVATATAICCSEFKRRTY
ncbi:TrmH family RNA methyltransferase [Sunxiuqinia indica]|uniref:TrmH family RNA methyltransferase n=1 Tax=Sunxiuqinia indica TaxID=2692584 RepID=UPI00135B49BE|nr:RNA methyltransferase [Sunxiuqinia indica]